MRLSSLALSLCLSLAASLSLSACGGGGDDDGGGNADARRVDALGGADSPPLADAAGAAVGLGQICGPSAACPAEGASQCTAVDGEAAVDGFCTMPCGDNSTGTLMPDHTICTGAYTASAGVAACILTDNVTTPTAFFCGIVCGSGTTPVDNGPCPGGLTCSLNLDPADPGSEACSD